MFIGAMLKRIDKWLAERFLCESFVEKENAVFIFAHNCIKFASFKTFHRNVLKGK